MGRGTGARAATPLKPLSPLQYPPPLIPPRGEVNAADAFDIGSFDEEDTKGIKVPGQRGRAVGGQGWQAAPDWRFLPASLPASCWRVTRSCTATSRSPSPSGGSRR